MFIHLQPKLMTGVKFFRICRKTLAATLRYLAEDCVVVDELYEPAEPIFPRGELRGEVMIRADDCCVFIFYQMLHRQEEKQENQHLKGDRENKVHTPLCRTNLLSSSAPAISASASTSGGNEKRSGLSGLLP